MNITSTLKCKFLELARLETRTEELYISASMWDVKSFMRSESRDSDSIMAGQQTELEHFCSDPKDGDLYLGWVKPGETLVEARSDTDVQIVRRI
jgi:hypothetical protein